MLLRRALIGLDPGQGPVQFLLCIELEKALERLS
jgi:hypothetical protein